MKKHAPLKTKKIEYRSTSFIDQSLKELMSKRYQIHKKARQTGAQSDWNQYRIMHDDVKRMLSESERNYVNKELEKNRSFIHELDEFVFKSCHSRGNKQNC